MNYVRDIRKKVGKDPIILVGSVVLLIKDAKILLQKRKNSVIGKWGLPGGLMELGESTEETAIREVKEETGLTLHTLELLEISSGSKCFVKIENGDEFYSVTSVYLAIDFTGELAINYDEAFEIQYFDLDQLPEPMVQSHFDMIDNYRSRLHE